MKRVGKSAFFIVLAIIVFLSVTSVFGISTQYADRETKYIKGADDIRLGIDIQGGVDVTFTPPQGVSATSDQMASAEQIIKSRLVAKNITDSEVYTDYSKQRIIVRFPWANGEQDFDPQKAIKELGETAELTFREGVELDSTGKPTGITLSNVILNGADVKKAYAAVDTEKNEPIVILNLNESGVGKFSAATEKLAAVKGVISIWMDDTLISYPQVSSKITGDEATITGGFTADEAKELASKINAGALPFKLETTNFSTITPTLGAGALNAMIMAGVIGFILVACYITFVYRLPGFIATIALIGQVAGSLACVSGYFPIFDSFTLTLPGIAGIILAIGFGVDANIISAERIKEELALGKTVDGAITAGFKKAFSAVFDGNITIIIVAIILMGAFGPTDSILSQIFSPIFFMFGATTAGTIYSFGYTLLIGVVFNLLMGVVASRVMLKSISKFKIFRNPKFYSKEAK